MDIGKINLAINKKVQLDEFEIQKLLINTTTELLVFNAFICVKVNL